MSRVAIQLGDVPEILPVTSVPSEEIQILFRISDGGGGGRAIQSNLQGKVNRF